MSESLNYATANTVAMYDEIPETFAGHFANFRSTVPDITIAHELAGVPFGESQVVEIGCGDGRDAETAFVPAARQYTGFDPSKGLLEIARRRFPKGRPDMFQEGYAQSTDYPEDTDVAMSINSVLHVPTGDLPDMFDNVGESLSKEGVLWVVTKVEPQDSVEVYHDDFNGVTGERTFYHHSFDTMTRVAEKAGLTVVRASLEAVPTKVWDWGTIAFQKS